MIVCIMEEKPKRVTARKLLLFLAVLGAILLVLWYHSTPTYDIEVTFDHEAGQILFQPTRSNVQLRWYQIDQEETWYPIESRSGLSMEPVARGDMVFLTIYYTKGGQDDLQRSRWRILGQQENWLIVHRLDARDFYVETFHFSI